MQIFGKKKFSFEERYFKKEKKGWEGEGEPVLPVSNLTRKLNLVGNLHKSHKDYKIYIESTTINERNP